MGSEPRRVERSSRLSSFERNHTKHDTGYSAIRFFVLVQACTLLDRSPVSKKQGGPLTLTVAAAHEGSVVFPAQCNRLRVESLRPFNSRGAIIRTHLYLTILLARSKNANDS